ncbi:MAG: hypothetical protein JWN70_6018 [Planctomycetaceae bacterium]|nr:hypothetical protein [Planctomycetaceae bacterium]
MKAAKKDKLPPRKPGTPPAATQGPPLPGEIPLTPGPGDPKQAWRTYFRENTPKPEQVTRLVVKLHEAKRDTEVIAVIEASILAGQSQTWMYEVLAGAMQVTGRPQADIERVLLSGVDFTAVDVPNMLFSAAYLTRYGLRSRALQIYRQASSLAPWRPEPYVLGLKLAREAKDPEALEWAATGILTQAWNKDHEALHHQADEAVAEAEQLFQKKGNAERLKQFHDQIASARQRDLVLKLTWNGDADLDLSVEEPLGTVCSRQNKYSRGGGVLVHDGLGPKPKDAYELYVCPVASTGDYRITVRYLFGNVVAKQAKLTIIRHQGTPDESTTSQSIAIAGEETVVRLTLKAGRRTELGPVIPDQVTDLRRSRTTRQQTTSEILQVVHSEEAKGQQAEYVRQRDILFQNLGGLRAAVQPVIQVIPEGVQATATAVVSADRRYVRLNLNPVFSAITDVFTFTFAGQGAGSGTSTPSR